MSRGGRLIISFFGFALAVLAGYLGVAMLIDGMGRGDAAAGDAVLGVLLLLIGLAIVAAACLPLWSRANSSGVPPLLMLLMLSPLLFALVTLPLFVAGVIDWPEWVRSRGPVA